MENKEILDKVKIKLSGFYTKNDLVSLAKDMKESAADELVDPLFINFVKKFRLSSEDQALVIRKLIDSGQVDKKSPLHSKQLLTLSNSPAIKIYFDALKPLV